MPQREREKGRYYILPKLEIERDREPVPQREREKDEDIETRETERDMRAVPLSSGREHSRQESRCSRLFLSFSSLAFSCLCNCFSNSTDSLQTRL